VTGVTKSEAPIVTFHIVGGTLIDGRGGAAVPDAEIQVEGDRIDYVGPRRAQRPAGTVYSAEGRTVMPGLIDAHVHVLADATVSRDKEGRSGLAGLAADTSATQALKSLTRLAAMIDKGFTTVRDLLGPNETIFSLREAVAAGLVRGPRIVASGKCVTMTAGHGTAYGSDMAWEADGPSEIKRAVRTQAKLGADVIKVMATTRSYVPPLRASLAFDRDELAILVRAARDLGLLVAAHAQNAGPDAIKEVALAGVHTIEHGRPLDDETARIMAERGTVYVPTLAVRFTAREALERRDPLWPEYTWPMIPRQFEEALRGMEAAMKHGVQIATGTDAGVSGVHHADSARELEYLCETGMSNAQAICAATSLASRACGLEKRTGTIERGKQADIVVVRGDPLADVRVLQDVTRIELVSVGGRILKQALAAAA
jgi:imidazolonepropionase-like amidohydrolase